MVAVKTIRRTTGKQIVISSFNTWFVTILEMVSTLKHKTSRTIKITVRGCFFFGMFVGVFFIGTCVRGCFFRLVRVDFSTKYLIVVWTFDELWLHIKKAVFQGYRVLAIRNIYNWGKNKLYVCGYKYFFTESRIDHHTALPQRLQCFA